MVESSIMVNAKSDRRTEAAETLLAAPFNALGASGTGDFINGEAYAKAHFCKVNVVCDSF
jgi:hypothetical protein